MRKPLKTAYIAGIETDSLSRSEVEEMVAISTFLDLDLVYELSDEADVILYAGGTDVNPAMYGEKPLATTQRPDTVRDGIETFTYKEGLKWGAVHVGVCRGMQLLNVLNGGKLWQHVDGHEGNHGIRTMGPEKYQGYYLMTTEVTSSHHQVIIPPRHGNEKHNPYFITAVAANTGKDEGSRRWMRNSTDKRLPDRQEVEGIWFPNTNSFGVQFHPGWNTESAKVLKDLFGWWVRKGAVSCVA